MASEHFDLHLFHENPELISAGIGFEGYSSKDGAAPAARHNTGKQCVYLSFLDGGKKAKFNGRILEPGAAAFPGVDLPVQYEYRYPARYDPPGTVPGAKAGPAGFASAKTGPGLGSSDVFRSIEKSQRFDPKVLCPGMSIGSPDPYRPGTLGCVVYSASGQRLGLSNWHILSSASGEVLRPSRYYRQARPDSAVFGRVGGSSPDHDCALATFDDSAGLNDEILGLGVAPAAVASAGLGARLVKCGPGSGLTFGRVVRRGLVKMNFGGRYDAVVVPCIELDSDPEVYRAKVEICKPGDSGAVWMHYKIKDQKAFQEQISALPEYLADPDAVNFDHTDVLSSFTATDAAALHFGEDNALMERALAVPMSVILHQMHVGLTPDWHTASAPANPAAKRKR